MARPKTTICPLCKKERLKVDQETGKLEEHKVVEVVSDIPEAVLWATVEVRCPGSDAVCGEWKPVSHSW